MPTAKPAGPDLFSWILGMGGAFSAGLSSFKLYEIWQRKIKKGTAAGTGSSSTFGGVAGSIGSGPGFGPNTKSANPNTGPTQPKNPDWVTGQQEFEKRWGTAKKKFSPVRTGETGNEPDYVLDRFKAGMNIVHEVSSDNAVQVPTMATRVRAGIEYLIPEIWPDTKILKRFFDPNFNAGWLSTEDIARISYLPEQYRNLSKFTEARRSSVIRIHRVLSGALHPNNPNIPQTDVDPNLQDSLDFLLRQFNSAWPYIENLILTPGNTPDEIRKAFGLFGKMASRAADPRQFNNMLIGGFLALPPGER